MSKIEEAQNIIIDMSFNLGYTKLSKFKNLRNSLKTNDYALASKHMKNSKWYGDVKSRGKELVSKMGSLEKFNNKHYK